MECSPTEGLKVNYSLEGRGLSACPGVGELGKLQLFIVRGNQAAIDLPKFGNILNIQGLNSCRNVNEGVEVPNVLQQSTMKYGLPIGI